jgi:hypothetical protein
VTVVLPVDVTVVKVVHVVIMHDREVAATRAVGVVMRLGLAVFS